MDEYYWTDLIMVPMIKNGNTFGYKFIEEEISEQKKVDSIITDIFGDKNSSLF